MGWTDYLRSLNSAARFDPCGSQSILNPKRLCVILPNVLDLMMRMLLVRRLVAGRKA